MENGADVPSGNSYDLYLRRKALSMKLHIPHKWLAAQPDLIAPDPDGDVTAVCPEHRRKIIEWITDGLDKVHADDEADRSERTYASCWDGKIVEVHRRAVEIADLVMLRAIEEAAEYGFAIDQTTRTEAGMSEDSERRVLSVACAHTECGPGVTYMEIGSPSANAALESRAPDIGFVTPSQAGSDEMRRYGLRSSVDKDTPVGRHLFDAINTRLALDADYHRHKPINTRHMVRDGDGYLRAVKPRSVPDRPDLDAVADFLAENHPNGVTLKEAGIRFGVSEKTMRRVVDDINPEFVYRGVPERCIRWKASGQRPFVWAVTANRDEIEDKFMEHGTVGREYDPVFTMSPGNALALSTDLALRW